VSGFTFVAPSSGNLVPALLDARDTLANNRDIKPDQKAFAGVFIMISLASTLLPKSRWATIGLSAASQLFWTENLTLKKNRLLCQSLDLAFWFIRYRSA
jgi:hypothetical protein